jgi:hypothetical protein
MTELLLFQCACSADGKEGFLGNEWMASAVGIAITYIVFVMGIPALLFQTFIPEPLRNIYNERFDNRWANFFKGQLLAAVILFFLSDPKIYNTFSDWVKRKCGLPESFHAPYFGPLDKLEQAEAIVALLVLSSVIIILYSGYRHLMYNFKSTRNVALQLSHKIVNDIIRVYDKHGIIDKKDLEDLSVLAKELKAGQTKNHFLEECERLIEHILDSEPSADKAAMVKKLLEEAVCRSITYEGAQVNEENRLKALGILILVHGHEPNLKPPPINGTPWWQKWYKKIKNYGPPIPQQYSVISYENTGNEYLHELIGYYVREVGVAAMVKNDKESVNEAVEKLYAIDADPKELFALGANAISLTNIDVVVASLKKLKSKAFLGETLNGGESPADETALKAARKHRRTLHFWLGLLAKIHLKEGAAREYAERQWKVAQADIKKQDLELNSLFEEAYKHFYRLTDFSTADDVRRFQTYLKGAENP